MEQSPVCVVMVTGRAQLESACQQAGAMAHVMKPLLAHQIPELLSEALQRFERFRVIAAAGGDPAAGLRAWVTVRRAIHRMSDVEGLSEEQAFERLLESAREQGQPPEQVAREILGNSGEC